MSDFFANFVKYFYKSTQRVVIFEISTKFLQPSTHDLFEVLFRTRARGKTPNVISFSKLLNTLKHFESILPDVDF